MDCCSSSNYVDYRHHSMNGNFCYPYSPNMLRSASPYPLAGTGRYGADYRSSPLGYHHHGVYDGYDKYYGGYHHASSSYQTGYYGNYPSSYRDYGSYGHYYHQSPSPYARGGGSSGAVPPGYGASPTGGGGAGGYLYPGRHYPASTASLAHPFGSRESSYYHAQREHHQQQYGSYANYGHLPPYRNGVGHEHPGGKSHHQPQQAQHQQPYPPQHTFAGSHNDRVLTGSVGSEGGTTATSHPSPPASTLFGAQNGYSSSSSDYTLPTSSYSSTADSPQHPLADERDVALTPTATPTPTTALLGATAAAAAEFPHGTKDNRMRKPKERKLHRAYGSGGSGRSSRTSSPVPAAVNGLSGSNGAAAATRMKSLDALTNLCWPDEDQFSGRMRKYSTANGLNNSRKESNELENASVASPSRITGPARRTKKQTPTSRQAKETKLAAESREKQTNRATPPTPNVENKNITPLPGFQQAFGSTEIGKFSEVFFNSSPTSASHSPPHHHHQQHHHHHPHHDHHQHPLQLQDTQSQQVPAQSHGTMQQLVMESLNAYESDVDTLSPTQAWDSNGPGGVGDAYENGGRTGNEYNLPIGTSFHPSYYESSSYSDHGVDSPLGNYFSEMTCNEFVN
uniref:Uncharacterized protein n=1 Tax=Anopheles minimus TaxID=112268 RepID=A0A182WBS9_9DIPT